MEEKPGESFDNLPPGYRFQPYTKELITYYLNPKINGIHLPMNPIHEVDNINVYGPEELTARFNPQGEGKCKSWYFFTPRNKKYPNGRIPDRKAGDRFWKATGKDHPIKDDDGKLIGHQRSLVYLKEKPDKNRNKDKKKNNNEKTQWHMQELRVRDDDQPKVTPKRKRDHQQHTDTSMRLDYVICKIYYNEGAKKEIKDVQVTKEDKEVVENNMENMNSHEQQISNQQFISNTFSVSNNNQFVGYGYDYEVNSNNNLISYDNNDGLVNNNNNLIMSYDNNDGLVNSNDLIGYDNDALNNSIYGNLEDFVPDFDSLYDKISTEELLDQLDFTD